jgi:hypothetical protein
LRALLTHEDLAVALLDRPARNRTRGRGTQGFTRPQVEAGVMPRAAHGVADDEALRERTVVMRAVSAYCEKLLAAPDQQHIVPVDMTKKLSSVRDIVLWKSTLQIRDARRRLVGHLGSSFSWRHASTTINVIRCL